LAYLDTEPLGGGTLSPTKNLIKPIRQDGFNRTLLLSDLPNYSDILLLQGPVGPFFSKLGHYWRNRGTSVTKVNFNSGDDLFYPPMGDSVIQYKGRQSHWPQFLTSLLVERTIRAVFIFGDCRDIHQPVHSLCEALGIDVYVFEEGYIRPHRFTLEKRGVNHRSRISQIDMDIIYKQHESHHEPPIRRTYPNSYWYMARWAAAYWLQSVFNQSHYPDYIHHRQLNAQMGLRWAKAFFRYWLYKLSEYSVRNQLLHSRKKGAESRSFLLPLQVHDDSQMTAHSDFKSIEEVIETVISSFSVHIQESKRSDILIIKHHPMDRGHTNFRQFIQNTARLYRLERQVLYVHDVSLPALLVKVAGCITVNSTIGLQALCHNVPTINLGRSFYDKPGITFQGGLDEFWSSQAKVDVRSIRALRNYLLYHTQVNGSLYDPKYQIE
jgi:capsular polysaccharide export protein